MSGNGPTTVRGIEGEETTVERLARQIAEAHGLMECGRLLSGAIDG
jgi:hypothetical protein